MNSGSWWWTGRPGVLRFMGSQRVGHDWATELNWTEHSSYLSCITDCVSFAWRLSGKESTCNIGDTGDLGLIPVSRRSLGEEMATSSSILAWRIPWTEEPGVLRSMGSQRVRHYWTTEHTHTQRLHVCIFPLKSICWNLNLRWDGIWRLWTTGGQWD